jgi:cell wall-associated NlpC family hydrolase
MNPDVLAGNHERADPEEGRPRLKRALGLAQRTVRARRKYATAAGAAAALLVTAAGWPAAAHPAPAGHAWRAAGHLETFAGLPLMMIPGGESSVHTVAPLRHRLRADILVVSAKPLPASVTRAIGRLRGVKAAEPVEAARVGINGKEAAVLGVDPSRFRRFAAKPTAKDSALWQAVADGEIALSYTMGTHDKLPVNDLVKVTGRQEEDLAVGGLGTVGIAGVDAVVSDALASSLGFPNHNAIVISVSVKRMSALRSQIKARVPKDTAVEQLFIPGTPSAAERAGVRAPSSPTASGSPTTSPYGLLTPAQTRAMLAAALSRRGMPYVWGAAGPDSFDCSGLVQWSFAQAGIVMPRVAADQARTGPAVSVGQLQPGALLFYHTDPTAPGYISHVAIYIGNGQMLQAPQPGMNVEIVPLDTGPGFAGAIAVSPNVAAAVAGAPIG